MSLFWDSFEVWVDAFCKMVVGIVVLDYYNWVAGGSFEVLLFGCVFALWVLLPVVKQFVMLKKLRGDGKVCDGEVSDGEIEVF